MKLPNSLSKEQKIENLQFLVAQKKLKRDRLAKEIEQIEQKIQKIKSSSTIELKSSNSFARSAQTDFVEQLRRESQK